MRPRYNATSTLGVLKEIAETLNRGVALRATMETTLPLVVELLGLHTGWLFLRGAGGELEVAAHHSLPPALGHPGEPWCGGCNCQTYASNGTLAGSAQVVECSRLRDASGDRHGLAYHASAPVQRGEEVLGILNVATSDWDTFTPQDLQVITAVGYQIAATVERIRLADQATQLALVEERNRLAREVHDTLAQELAGIALQLEAADALLDASPERARARLLQALERTRESLAEARRSVLDLRAGPLERRPLAAALVELGRRFAEETGLAVTVDAAPEGPRAPAGAEAALYRIAQEALANVRRHASARAVRVALRQQGGRATLTVRDDGRGMAPDEAAAPGRFGLLGMRERARLAGGELSIESAPGAGTTVRAEVPAA